MQNIAVGERYPDITRLSPISKPSAYGAAIIDFLDRVTYKVMRSEHDCECVFKVRHDAYFDAGHISAAGDQRFEDAFDRDPTFFNIGVHVDGELAACLRLNCLTAGGSQSPTLITHSGLLVPFLNMGLRITDSTRFCAVKGASDRYKLLPFAAIRLSGLHAAHYQTALVASSVQNRHLPFYARFLGSKVMEDEETVSKGLTMRVRLTLANIAEIRRSCYVDRQFFFSSPDERRALFEDGSSGFIQPTARAVIENGVDPEFWF
jgi:hypothetical protein